MDHGRRQFLAGSAGVGLALVAADAGAATPARVPPTVGARERLSLDGGWRFVPYDIAFPDILGHEASYANAKAGNATGAASTDYDDGDWDRVDLPHDWAVNQPYDPTANIDQGYRRRGIGWYRRSFVLDPADRTRHLELQFGAASTHATVWINGTLVHRHFTGFTGFTIDLTPFALFGEDINTLAVRVDATASEGWWYEGAGLYRHVWLVKRGAVYIVTDGVHADPRRAPDGGWSVPVETLIENAGRASADAEMEAVLFDPHGHPIGAARAIVTVAALGRAGAALSISIPTPLLWSPDRPTLYTLRTLIRVAGEMLDTVDTTIGFRTIRFDADRGFLLNEAPLKLKGVCAHQDHAGVGVAVPDSIWDYRLRRLKAMGANALRCAHNAPATELLDAADRIGFLVMDETRNFNASEDYLPQLEWLVRRDRNHPSVILWSVCNEESLQSSMIGVEMVRRMKALVRTLDDSRPVTAAMNGGMFATLSIAQELDVVGFNYGIDGYDRFHAANPGKPMLSSEDGSAYMTRGDFVTDPARHTLSSYDTEHTAWGASYRDAWKAIAERPFMAGGFLWTGFDYRGEPTPYEWPSASSSFGAMDLCGFAKTAFHIRRALWVRNTPVLEIAPHWTWPGCEGTPIEVMAISNADRVVLSLNGRIVADLAIDPYQMASVSLPYAPGRLSAIAYRGGRAIAQTSLETTTAPARLRLTPDRAAIAGDGRDALPITVDILDGAGRSVPTANTDIGFFIHGGHILGVGNGDPTSHERDHPSAEGARRRLYNGLAQLIVQAIPGAPVIVVKAHADGMRPAILRVPILATGASPAVAPRDGVQMLTEWRTSPGSATRPDPTERLAEGDMNSWGWLKPGSTQKPLPEGRYSRVTVQFVAWAAVRRAGGDLTFARLAGRVEIWLDGKLAMTKDDPEMRDVRVPLSSGDGQHVVTLLFDAPPGSAPFGIAGAIKVEPSG